MKSLLLLAALVFANCWWPTQANAQSCYGQSGASGECAKIIDVAVYGDTDRRRTEEEFAKDVGESLSTIHNRFAATGTLSCLGSIPCDGHPEKRCPVTVDGAAQLTVGTDVITTAGHSLIEPDSCLVMAKAENCTFTIVGNGRPQVIKVNNLVGQGFKCPAIPTPDLDWAVMKLSQKVKGVVPYHIDPNLVMGVKAGDQVLNVCRSMDFVRTNSKGVASNPKHINSCSVKRVYHGYGNPIYFSTDCDSAILCSGGSLLNGNQDDPALLGMNIRGDETKAVAEQAVKSHTVDKRPYDEQNWGSRYVPFAGDFLEAIKRANEGSATSKHD
jgi:hypothetical protein